MWSSKTTVDGKLVQSSSMSAIWRPRPCRNMNLCYLLEFVGINAAQEQEVIKEKVLKWEQYIYIYIHQTTFIHMIFTGTPSSPALENMAFPISLDICSGVSLKLNSRDNLLFSVFHKWSICNTFWLEGHMYGLNRTARYPSCEKRRITCQILSWENKVLVIC